MSSYNESYVQVILGTYVFLFLGRIPRSGISVSAYFLWHPEVLELVRKNYFQKCDPLKWYIIITGPGDFLELRRFGDVEVFHPGTTCADSELRIDAEKGRTKKEEDLRTELCEVSLSVYGLSKTIQNSKITWSVQSVGVKTWTGLNRDSETIVYILAKPCPGCVTLYKIARPPLHLSF